MRNIRIWNQQNIEHFEWNDSENHQIVKSLVLPLMQNSSSKFIKNAHVQVEIVEYQGGLFPITINENNWHNCYTAAPFGIMPYSHDEMSHLGAFEKGVLKCGLWPVSLFLKLSRINHVVCVNNFLLSTNLYPHITVKEIEYLTAFLRKTYPQHAILWRSLNDYQHSKWLPELKNKNYRLAASRSIWFFNEPFKYQSKRVKKTLKEDLKLQQKTTYKLVMIDKATEGLFKSVKDLYDQLYLEKYSFHNPQFTEFFFENFLASPNTVLFGLYEGDTLQGVVGSYIYNQTITTPIVGYNIKKPQGDGLYRLLTWQVMTIAQEQHLLLNHSSGAGHFKRGRGAIGSFEYTAVYIDHLSFWRKPAWYFLELMLNTVGVYFLRKYRL